VGRVLVLGRPVHATLCTELGKTWNDGAVTSEVDEISIRLPREEWLPAAAVLFFLGAAYALVSERLTLGPPWLLLVLIAVAFASSRVLHVRGLERERRLIALVLSGVVTIAVAESAVVLVLALLRGSLPGLDLLRDGVLLWVSNLFSFTLWYWEVDGGGPVRRRRGPHASTDFAFPQQILNDKRVIANWKPQLADYLFLAFNTSTAFSPTDTMVLARRAKLLMMVQSLVSLLTVVVIVGRAINTLA
jgi:hypothetical protein